MCVCVCARVRVCVSARVFVQSAFQILRFLMLSQRGPCRPKASAFMITPGQVCDPARHDSSAPKGHKNTRILQNMISVLPPVLGLGTTCRILMFMWSLGPLHSTHSPALGQISEVRSRLLLVDGPFLAWTPKRCKTMAPKI